MDSGTLIDPYLTYPDLLVLQNLLGDIQQNQSRVVDETEQADKASCSNGGTGSSPQNASFRARRPSGQDKPNVDHDNGTIERLKALNNPKHEDFDPTIFVSWDTKKLMASPSKAKVWLLHCYSRLGRRIVRVETDVVMLTHLLLYFSTSVPSAAFLYYHFTWVHGIFHFVMQSYYVGTYTLMMHQHIHMKGILSKQLWLVDVVFPYILDPLLGHTWNSYFFHHVKHHHVEGNGPDDLSSTIYYQRDSVFDFCCYVGRFFFFIWLELPLYFIRKGKYKMAVRAGGWELANYMFISLMYTQVAARATIFVFILPLLLLRLGLMVGNWGQHALVDEVDPKSDFHSSITLIDVASNRFCYNDGYHTSHQLNPRRHWREHPVAFMMQKERYRNENALVFANIDYLMMTYRLLRKDYMYLAKCLVPMGEQMEMTLVERAEMLRTKTRRFSKEDIRRCFAK